MNRRTFILKTAIATGGCAALKSFATTDSTGRRISWLREGRLFTAVSCEGRPMTTKTEPLLTASCRLADGSDAAGLLHMTLIHTLRDSGAGNGDDLLEAELTLTNTSGRLQRVDAEFATAAQPSPRTREQRVYLPLSAAALLRDARFSALGVKNFLQDCNQPVGTGNFTAHYLEPMASYPAVRETSALMLAPVIDINHPQAPWHVALFTASDQPVRFTCAGGVWRAGRQVAIEAGGTSTHRCWMLLHTGDASTAWKAFRRFAHREDYPLPDWVREQKVHYFDFLSSARGEDGRRGDGYDADLAHFREFRVGLATQHGYYPAIGDYIRPDRKTWLAMRGDKQGAATMSFDIMRARIKATRACGARAAVYMHPALFDDASSCFAKLHDCVQVNEDGQRMTFGWTGPDTAGKTWRASLASEAWRGHLLEEAGWIMDILQPDAIVVDETFAGLGYDYQPGRAGPTSSAAIDFFRKLRSLVRSFGSDKALFTSDCSMSPFVLWADGESGDHAYPHLLGHPLYTQEPVRYLAALGSKPWIPCAWDFQRMWAAQMKLAHLVGSGAGVSNGWLEYTGLSRLPADVKAGMLADIASLG